jgi:hypothetical protein
MQPLEMEPQIDPAGKPFYAKLRAEADSTLVQQGVGKLYLGFHLDPVYGAHWNNLVPPLKYTLDLPDVGTVARREGEGPKVDFAADADPREFLVDVSGWPTDLPIRLTVTYAACVNDGCHVVRQTYLLYRRRDRDGGLARGAGAGFWDPDEFVRQMLTHDRNGDGKLSRDEATGLLVPHFDRFDTNRDGRLDADELREAARWLNSHHQPGWPVPAR